MGSCGNGNIKQVQVQCPDSWYPDVNTPYRLTIFVNSKFYCRGGNKNSGF